MWSEVNKKYDFCILGTRSFTSCVQLRMSFSSITFSAIFYLVPIIIASDLEDVCSYRSASVPLIRNSLRHFCTSPTSRFHIRCVQILMHYSSYDLKLSLTFLMSSLITILITPRKMFAAPNVLQFP